MSDLLRSTWLLAVLDLVIAGMRNSCSGYAGFGLGCLQRRRGARETQKFDLRAILRYTGVLAALGSVVAGVRECPGL